MTLLDKLKGASRYINPVRSRDHFKDLYLDKIVQSKELRQYFFDSNERVEDAESKYMYNEVVKAIDKAYGANIQFYEKGLLRRFVAKPLRMAGVGLAVISHYFVNVYLSPEAYALLIQPALGMMAAADAIEGVSYFYHNHSKYDLKQLPKLLLESISEKAMAVIPTFVTPGIEATLGSTKFDRAVARKMIYEVKNEFIGRFGEHEKQNQKLDFTGSART